MILMPAQVWGPLNWLIYRVPSSSNLWESVNWKHAPESNIFQIIDTNNTKDLISTKHSSRWYSLVERNFLLKQFYILSDQYSESWASHPSTSTCCRLIATIVSMTTGPLLSEDLNTWEDRSISNTNQCSFLFHFGFGFKFDSSAHSASIINWWCKYNWLQ